jgi:glycosyltransferase involved in cell wall biosynthesis
MEKHKLPMFSFAIPAFNNPELLLRCLDSIAAQRYPQIEIYVLDDYSPRALQPTVDCFREEHPNICIRFCRQEKNLGVYWNSIDVLSRCTGDYLILMQHDDYLTSPEFLNHCLKIFEENKRVNCYISNAVFELSGKTLFDRWIESGTYVGAQFIARNLFRDIHPSYSSVVIRKSGLNVDEYAKFFVEKDVADALQIEMDECFQIICVAAGNGDVFVDNQITSVRGQPLTAATKLNLLPQRYASRGMLVSFYNLYKYFSVKGELGCAREMRRIIVTVFNSHRVNLRLFKFFEWDLRFIWFCYLGASYKILQKIISVLRPTKNAAG